MTHTRFQPIPIPSIFHLHQFYDEKYKLQIHLFEDEFLTNHTHFLFFFLIRFLHFKKMCVVTSCFINQVRLCIFHLTLRIKQDSIILFNLKCVSSDTNLLSFYRIYNSDTKFKVISITNTLLKEMLTILQYKYLSKLISN